MTTVRGDRQELIRPGLLPGVIAATAALAGLALLESDLYLVIRFVLSILAAIMAVCAWQGGGGCG